MQSRKHLNKDKPSKLQINGEFKLSCKLIKETDVIKKTLISFVLHGEGKSEQLKKLPKHYIYLFRL